MEADSKKVLIGIVAAGVQHASTSAPLDLESKFRMASEAQVFDYLDFTPPSELVADCLRFSDKYSLPILAGSANYVLGRDEPLLASNLRLGAELGSVVHNTQVFMDHANGHLISNDEVMRAYMNAYELGEQLGCLPMFEVHVNMWSEKFTRVSQVADMVEARGVPFRMTLDHSHVIFKINNPRELAVFSIDKAIERGEIIIDPFLAGNVFDEWISKGLVGHAHARSASTNNPLNSLASHPGLDQFLSSLHPKSLTGRGIQYPFIQPEEGQWHSAWDYSALDSWKAVVRKLFAHHARSESSELKTISTEFIPFTDYAAGATYSLLDNAIACAKWLSETWQEASDEAANK
jgi:hypothetical protein